MRNVLQVIVIFSILIMSNTLFAADKLDGLTVSEPTAIYRLVNGNHKELYNPYCMQAFINGNFKHPLKIAAGFVISKIALQRIVKVNDQNIEKAYIQATFTYSDKLGTLLEPHARFKCLVVK